jgi:hypothetical protein
MLTNDNWTYLRELHRELDAVSVTLATERKEHATARSAIQQQQRLLLAVAPALEALANYPGEVNLSDYQGLEGDSYCAHCGVTSPLFANTQVENHARSCPVLLARAFRTQNPKER